MSENGFSLLALCLATLVIWGGIFSFLLRLDRRISKLEKDQ